MTIQELVDDIAGWDAYVSKSSASSIYHFSGWRDVIKESFGHNCRYIYATNSVGEIIGILPLVQINSVLFGNYMVSMPFFNYGGVLSENEGVRQKLIDAAIEIGESLRVSHIEVRSDVEGLSDELPVRKDKISMRLDLPNDEKQLWKGIGSKLRAQIKRPQREGAKVKIGGKEFIEEFYSVFSRNMRDLGTPVYSIKFFKSIFNHFKGCCNIVLVQLNGKSVAAGLLIHHNRTTEIPWASSLREYNRIGVNMLMYWEVLKLSIIKGSKAFDFGRSTLDSGTYRFKKQWGASPHQLYWYYWLRNGEHIPVMNPTNPKYRMAIKVWKKLPLTIANMLGPPVVKNLP